METKPKNRSLPMWIAIVCCAVAIGAVALQTVGAQVNTSACGDAERYHLEQAMSWWQKDEQEYHMRAAQAAHDLGEAGGSCLGWQDVSSLAASTNV